MPGFWAVLGLEGRGPPGSAGSGWPRWGQHPSVLPLGLGWRAQWPLSTGCLVQTTLGLWGHLGRSQTAQLRLVVTLVHRLLMKCPGGVPSLSPKVELGSWASSPLLGEVNGPS